MHTVKLRVNDSVYNQLIELLGKFNKEEIEIIPETSEYAANQKYLYNELKEINEGKANFLEMNEAEQRLEKAIKRDEDNI